ncbi:hypothetical protein L208DRAFT_1498043, partial [Tricholoma matsutake]
ILGIGKGVLRVFSSDFPLLGTPPNPVICSIILTSDFPLLEAEVALIVMDFPSLCLPPNVLVVQSVVPMGTCQHSQQSSHVSSTCPHILCTLPCFSFLAFTSFPSFFLLLFFSSSLNNSWGYYPLLSPSS